MLRAWLRQWSKQCGLAKARRRRLRTAQLDLELLERRLAPAGNIDLTNALVVDGNENPLTNISAGQWVYIEADWTTANLPDNASYSVSYMVNGLTLNTGNVTFGAGYTTGTWDYYWGTFLATPGTNQVVVTVDPDNTVAETTYADNSMSFTFTASQATSSTFLSYTAAQMRNAYGVNSIPNFAGATPDGTGQTIAIINGGNDPSLYADVDGFDQAMSLTTTSTQSIYQQYGAASSFLTVYNQNGVNITANLANSGSNGVPPLPSTSEESWDVEWAHTMAPGAKIDEIEFDPTGNWPANLLTSYGTAATLPGVSSVNWSGGLSQWSTESSYDPIDFVTPSGHTGVTFICPSNDNGANVYPQDGQGDGYYPATSPNAVSVGGTTLIVNNDGYGGETAWSYPTASSVIASGSATYSPAASWSTQVGGYSGTYETAAAGSSSTATWVIPVDANNTGWGTELSVDWTPSPTNATNATYSVYDGNGTSGTLLGTIAVDQTQTPLGTLDGSTQFQELGVFFPTLNANGHGHLTVVLNAQSANGTVVADAIGSAPAWASTGGPAFFEAEPAYQLPFQTTGFRVTPDVSFDANFSADGYGGGGLTYGGGGTSLGGPCWDGLIAVANQARIAAGGSTLDSPANPMQAVEALYALPADDYHDIISGYNGFEAGPGYDFVTGRGSPIANTLIPDLAAYQNADQLVITAEPPSNIVAGAPFAVSIALEDAFGNVDSSYSGPVTFTIATGPNGSDISGTYTGNAVNGVATFDNLLLTTAGTYTLAVSADGFIATTGSLSVVPGAVDDANSLIVASPAVIPVGGTAIVTLTARDAYGNVEPTGGLSVAFNLAGGTGTGTFSAVTDHHNGTYTATFTGTGLGINDIAATIGGQPANAAEAPITIQATPTISWTNPADIVSGTALGAAQLDAVASIPGTFNYTLANGSTPANGAVLNVGTGQTLNVTFTPTDTTDYTTASASVVINVLPVNGLDVVGAAMEGLQFRNATIPGSFGAVLQKPIGNQPEAYDANGDWLYLIDPYSANVGLFGLLQAGLPGALQTASLWMQWYIGNLNADGSINRFWVEANGTPETPIESGYTNPDSVDSYAATFLTLSWEFVEAGGSTSFFTSPGVQQKYELIAQAILNLQDPTDGLTWTSNGSGVKELGDNSEVIVGLNAMAHLEANVFQNASNAAADSAAAGRVSAGIQNEFVDPSTGLFRIAYYASSGFVDADFTAGAPWYPNNFVIVPALEGVISPSSAQAETQIAAIDGFWNGSSPSQGNWTDSIVDSAGYLWPSVGYEALIGNDAANGATSINWVYGQDFTGQPSPPPITVDQMGWLMRGLNALAGKAPTSSVQALPTYEDSLAFNVSWSGSDYTGGAGIASYDVLYSDDGGPWTSWLTNTTQTSGVFTGQDGHAYAFLSTATDALNNVQPTPGAAQATTKIDVTPPTSSVSPLPTYSTSTSFTVGWTGSDNAGGSGVASFNIDVSDDGGPYTLWRTSATAGSAVYTGQAGHTYAFYSIATDNAGNVQSTPTSPQAQTLVDTVAPTSSVSTLPTFSMSSFTVDWSGSDNIGGSGLAGIDVYVSDDGGTYTLWQAAPGPGSATYTGQNGHTYAFYSVATDNAGNVQPTPGVAQASTEVDAVAPTSSVHALAGFSPASFAVSWSGSDNLGGSGIGSFNVYVADDGGPYTLWLSAAGPNSATYTGQNGHTYGFYSIAVDNAGNVQPTPGAAQATTEVDAVAPTSSVSALAPFINTPSFTIAWTGGDNVGGSGLAGINVYVSDDNAPYVLWRATAAAGSATYRGQNGHVYAFYSVATDVAGNVQATPGSPQAATEVDTVAPTSSISALPSFSQDSFAISWTGSDNIGGSGLASISIYVSEDNAAYNLWQSASAAGSAIYTGQDGHTYSFYSVATDNAGNVQATPTMAQATTQVDAIPPTSAVSALPTYSQAAFNVAWTGSDNVGGSGLANIAVYVSDDGGSYTLWHSAADGGSATFTGQNGQVYAFYSVAADGAGNVQAAPTSAQASTQVDAVAPTSSVNALPSWSPNNFTVAWTGSDNAGGSGLANIAVYVSDDGGPYTLWQSANAGGSATYSGLNGHAYAFYSIATDVVGNVQATPSAAQATTQVDAVPPTSSVSALPAFSLGSFNVAWIGSDNVGGSGLAGIGVYVSDNDGPFTLWYSAASSGSAIYTGQNGHTYAFYSLATDVAGNVQSAPAAPQATTQVDTVAPTSSVSALPVWSTASFNVAWSGSDNAGGSGIAGISVYVSDNGGAFSLWHSAAGSGSATYSGQNGHSYAFYSIAADVAGNVQATPSAAQASTQVDAVPPTSSVSTLAAFSLANFNVAWSGSDNAGGSGLASIGVYVSDDGGPFTLWQTAAGPGNATYTGQDGHTYAFDSIATDSAGNVQPMPGVPQAKTQVDDVAPTSSVSALPDFSLGTFSVAWTGSDNVGGSGLAHINVYVADDNGPFTLLTTAAGPGSINYTGANGHTYAFYSVASDVAGNVQATPAVQASTQVDTVAPTSAIGALPAFSTANIDVSWSGSDNAGGSGIAGYAIYVSDNGGPYSLWKTFAAAGSATYPGLNTHTYDFYSIATDNAGITEPTPAGAEARTEVDAIAPTSSVDPLPAYSLDAFNVSWSGSDNPGGSNVAGYSVYVADDGGPYALWQTSTGASSALFEGQDGHTYAFYSLATDNAGNVQAIPANPQATTIVDFTSPTVAVNPLPAFSPPAFTVSWSGSDGPNGSGIASFSVYVSDDGGTFMLWQTAANAGSAVYHGQNGHTYAFYTIGLDNAGNIDPVPDAPQATTAVDSIAPTSSVSALSSFSPGTFNVSWSGADNTGGSGIASYAIYVSADGGPFTLWHSAATAGSAPYTGQNGQRYAFYSIATDMAGNVQPTPTGAQAQTQVDTIAPTSHVTALQADSLPSFTVSWSGQDNPGGAGIAGYDVYDSPDGGPWQLWQTGTPLTSAVFTGSLGHSYAFYSLATDQVGNQEVKSPLAEATTRTPALQFPLTQTQGTTAPATVKIASLLTSHFSDADANAKPGIAIFAVSGAGTWQYSSGGAWTAIGAVSQANALLLPQADSLRFLAAASFAGPADLGFVAWDGSVGSAGGTANVSAQGGGASFSLNAGMVAVNVTPLNRAPSWSAATADFTPVQPATIPPGDTVAAVFGPAFTDSAGAPVGVAVIGVTGVSSGTWEYSTDQGATWTPFGSAATTFRVPTTKNALLLAAADLVRFVPNAGFAGAATLTADAWSGTQGTAAASGATSGYTIAATGGTTAFSSTTLTATLYVHAAPTLADMSVSTFAPINEGAASATVVASTLLRAAGASGDATGVAIVGAAAPGRGSWQYHLAGVSAWSALPAVSETSAFLLPASASLRLESSSSPPGAATLTFRAWDGTAGTAGKSYPITATGGAAAISSGEAATSVSVNAVNHAPTWTAASIVFPSELANTTPAGATVDAVFGSAFADIDGNAPGIAVVGLTGATTGVWEYSVNGSNWTTFGSAQTTFKVPSSANALLLPGDDLVRYVPNAGFLGSAALTVDAWDGTQGIAAAPGATVGYKIAANGGGTAFSNTSLKATVVVNIAPTLGNLTPNVFSAAIVEGSSSPVVGTAMLLADAGASSTAKGIAVTNTFGGTWQYLLAGTTAWTALPAVSESFAFLLPANASIRLLSAANQNGAMTLAFRAWDATLGSAGKLYPIASVGNGSAFSAAEASIRLTVNPVNHAPTWTGSGPALTPVLPGNYTPTGAVPPGNSVASVFGGFFADLDGNPVGIAVSAISNTANGTWQYSLDGVNWIDMPTTGPSAISAGSALLLAGSDWIRFVPNAGFLGTASLTAYAWDGTSGSAGGTANLAASGATGGNSAFTATSLTATVLVNTAPTLM